MTSSTLTAARFPALGGTAIVALADGHALPAARAAVEDVVDQFDRACSTFREDSELMLLNARAGTPVPVSPLLIDALQAAMRAAQLTDGDVDPTVGASLVALGRYSDEGERDARRVRFAAVPGWRAVQVDPVRRTVQLSPGVRLDLSATAKALAADRAALAARDAAGCGALVSLSGDLAIAGPAPAAGWRVRVTDDHRSGVDAPGQWISLRSGALATSSTTVSTWSVDGARAHHVIDPRTGRPARVVWRTVSVAAASCLDANIASTAAIVRAERAEQWLRSSRLPSRLVSARGTARHVGGWPEEGEDLPAEREGPE